MAIAAKYSIKKVIQIKSNPDFELPPPVVLATNDPR